MPTRSRDQRAGARTALDTINHSLLSLKALRSRSVPV